MKCLPTFLAFSFFVAACSSAPVARHLDSEEYACANRGESNTLYQSHAANAELGREEVMDSCLAAEHEPSFCPISFCKPEAGDTAFRYNCRVHTPSKIYTGEADTVAEAIEAALWACLQEKKFSACKIVANSECQDLK